MGGPLQRVLGADLDELPWLDFSKCVLNIWRERCDGIGIIADGTHKQDRYWDVRKVLLLLDVGINSEEALKLRSRQSKQLPVLDTRPPHFHNCRDIVVGQFTPQTFRNTLIKQHAHGREPGLQLAAEQLRPVRV